jgi:hypothetical protein
LRNGHEHGRRAPADGDVHLARVVDFNLRFFRGDLFLLNFIGQFFRTGQHIDGRFVVQNAATAAAQDVQNFIFQFFQFFRVRSTVDDEFVFHSFQFGFFQQHGFPQYLFPQPLFGDHEIDQGDFDRRFRHVMRIC